MTFAQPVAAVGFDLLFQELDVFSFVSFTVLGPNGQTLFSNSSVPTGVNFGGGVPGGPIFVGFISSSANISTIIINDSDGDGVNPDSNIGIDSIRLVPTLPAGGAVSWTGIKMSHPSGGIIIGITGSVRYSLGDPTSGGQLSRRQSCRTWSKGSKPSCLELWLRSRSTSTMKTSAIIY